MKKQTYKDNSFIEPFRLISKLFISFCINGNAKYIPLFLQITLF